MKFKDLLEAKKSIKDVDKLIDIATKKLGNNYVYFIDYDNDYYVVFLDEGGYDGAEELFRSKDLTEIYNWLKKYISKMK